MSTKPLHHLRTANMDWVSDPNIPGFKRKLLNYDDENGSLVQLWFVPPGWGEEVLGGKPHRHYHKSVVERGFHLHGDFPHWEFAGIDDIKGDCVILRKDHFLDRPPGSLHGLYPEPKSQTGAVTLYWNSGPGTNMLEPEYPDETVDVPFTSASDVGRSNFPTCNISDVSDISWLCHPNVSGWKYKNIGPAHNGTNPAYLVHVPAGWKPKNNYTARVQNQTKSWLFAISGDLSLEFDDRAILLRESDYLYWEEPKTPSLENAPTSKVGFVALCVGHMLI